MKLLEHPRDTLMQTPAAPPPERVTTSTFVIVDFGDPVALDVAAALRADSGTSVRYVAPKQELPTGLSKHVTVVVFTGADEVDSAEVSRVAMHLTVAPGSQLCVVTGCSDHFRSQADRPDFGENLCVRNDQKSPIPTQCIRLRIGLVLSPHSRVAKWCRRLAWLSPLLSEIPSASFVTLDELTQCLRSFATGHSDATDSAVAPRSAITLLGANRPWRDVLREFRSNGLVTTVVTWIAGLLSCLGAGLLLRQFLRFSVRQSSALRPFSFDSISPQSEAELLSLCNEHNVCHIAVCGYNNGVNHFGWKHQGRTVIPTAKSGSTIEVDGDHLLVDAGVTLKQCINVLAAAGRQFYVVPNYSYIGMGTVFFVPVHGSGSDVSTLGDTIQWVRLFNPMTGEYIEASRGEPVFQNTMYNRNSGLILLQMILKVRDITDYFVQTTTLTSPSAEQVWNLFFDEEASNIEVRRNRAASEEIRISKYYTGTGDAADRLSVPRDTIGSLWDRLEENRVTAYLFHLLVRKLAYHVELFLREDEFAVFWKQHQRLPVSKIQLRLARQDGMPHSPFGDADCVSADLFMSKRRRNEFQQFIKTELPNVRLNPGKQSM
ncbi:MAG: FAD-binding protein [Planctomycetaceae bacterium]